MVIISAQLAAAFALPPERELARLLIFVLAAVMEALLAARLATFLISLLESLAQEERAVLARLLQVAVCPCSWRKCVRMF